MALSLILAALTVVGVLLGSRPWETSSSRREQQLGEQR